MARYCIVLVGFDRPASLKRLLKSVIHASYKGHTVDLLISIDGGPRSEHTLDRLGPVDWPHGNCVIRRMSENMGLRRHVMHSGDVALDYDAIVMLEDDVIVGPAYFAYVNWAIQQYAQDDRIAGISLYAPNYNEMANLPFQPTPSGSPVYTLQSAQSWGQCWSRMMWRDFRAWYDRQPNELSCGSDMPERIHSWPASSWKKFAMRYLTDTRKTWIYPYVSHSSNWSELGTHNAQASQLFQVPLASTWAESAEVASTELVGYDIFFERIDMTILGETELGNKEEVVCDLYGTRTEVVGPVCLATVRVLPQSSVQEIGFNRKPHEANIEWLTPGHDARLYKIDAGESVQLSDCRKSRAVGFYSQLEWRDSLRLAYEGLRQAIVRRLQR